MPGCKSLAIVAPALSVAFLVKLMLRRALHVQEGGFVRLVPRDDGPLVESGTGIHLGDKGFSRAWKRERSVYWRTSAANPGSAMPLLLTPPGKCEGCRSR